MQTAARSVEDKNGEDGMIVTGLPAPRIGELAASASLVLHELTPRLPSLEEAFMELTADSVEFGKTDPGKTAPAAAESGTAGGTPTAGTS